MRIQQFPVTQANELPWLPPYSPIETELDGFRRIIAGLRCLQLAIEEGDYAFWRSGEREVDDGCCCALGVAMIGTGLWQLRVPIIMGVASYAFVSYSFR